MTEPNIDDRPSCGCKLFSYPDLTSQKPPSLVACGYENSCKSYLRPLKSSAKVGRLLKQKKWKSDALKVSYKGMHWICIGYGTDSMTIYGTELPSGPVCIWAVLTKTTLHMPCRCFFFFFPLTSFLGAGAFAINL